MATLIYNGIALQHCHLEAYNEDPVWEGPDYLYTRISIRVRGYVIAGSSLSTPAKQWPEIRHMLETPRMAMSYGSPTGNTVSIDPTGTTPGSVLDVRDGPKPLVLGITRIDGDVVFVIFFQVECNIRPCDPAGANGLFPPLSHRWEEQETLGPDFLAKRMRAGKIVLRASGMLRDLPNFYAADIDDAGNFMRQLASPGVPQSFQRMAATYAIANDGMSASYRFEDQQRYRLPPAGTIEMSGDMTDVTQPMNAKRSATFTVNLTGDPDTPKAVLIATGLNAVYQWQLSLKQYGAQGTQLTFSSMGITIRSSIHENKIRIQAIAPLITPVGQPTSAGKADSQQTYLQRNPALNSLSSTSVGYNAISAFVNSLNNASPNIAEMDLTYMDMPLWSDGMPADYTETGRGTTVPSPPMPFRSMAGLQLLAATFNDPCLQTALSQAANSIPGSGPPSSSGTTFIDTPSWNGNPLSSTTATPTIVNVEEPPEPFTILDTTPVSQNPPYTVYTITPRYSTDYRKIALPGPTNVIWMQISAPVATLEVTTLAVRDGMTPEVLPLEFSGNNAPSLLRHWEEPVIEMTSGGQTRYQLTYHRVYGFTDATKVQFLAAVTPEMRDLGLGFYPSWGSSGNLTTPSTLSTQAASLYTNINSNILPNPGSGGSQPNT